MNDIAERMRAQTEGGNLLLLREAAAEIERLQAASCRQQNEIERLLAERLEQEQEWVEICVERERPLRAEIKRLTALVAKLRVEIELVSK